MRLFDAQFDVPAVWRGGGVDNRNGSSGGGALALSPVRSMIKGCLQGCIEAAETVGDSAAVEALHDCLDAIDPRTARIFRAMRRYAEAAERRG